MSAWGQDLLARPDLPKPGCRVKLICGPPAAGKTTLVKKHRGARDIVIDLDDIARDFGLTRNRDSSFTAALLRERNARLAALANEPSERVAWVILTAPAPSLRQWWCKVLGVQPYDMILLWPQRSELYQRIRADPERRHVQQLYFKLVDDWFNRERADDPGIINSGCDINGHPIDPLHPWQRWMEQTR